MTPIAFFTIERGRRRRKKKEHPDEEKEIEYRREYARYSRKSKASVHGPRRSRSLGQRDIASRFGVAACALHERRRPGQPAITLFPGYFSRYLSSLRPARKGKNDGLYEEGRVSSRRRRPSNGKKVISLSKAEYATTLFGA